MSIDDDYFDVGAFVRGTDLEEAFDAIMEYVAFLEKQNSFLKEENLKYVTTIETLTKMKKPKPKKGPSPYDAGANRGLKR